MALYTISDLHLPLGVNKPMDIFGKSWENYVERLEENWKSCIGEDDWVVLGGDFSWALKMSESYRDFEFINHLPGKKFLLKGNHDYWWDTVSKLKRFMAENNFENIYFMQNNCFVYKDTAICGSRFWPCGTQSDPEDEKIYLRELGRIELGLKSAAESGAADIILFIHYPPFSNSGVMDENLMRLLKEYKVSRVIYGHIHGNSQRHAYSGEYDGIIFDRASCDYLQFMPIKLKD